MSLGLPPRPVDCAAVERWLDAGAAEPSAAIDAHVADCARCTAALVAVRAIDGWLAHDAAELRQADAAGATGDGSDFADAVMRRIAHAEAARAPAAAWAGLDAPWWIDALRHPAMVLATVLMALTLWQFGALLALGSGAATDLGRAAARWESAIGAWSGFHALASAVPERAAAFLLVGLVFALAPIAVLAGPFGRGFGRTAGR